MKNIVLISFDSLRADHCGWYGYQRDTTPNMDQLAADGVSFTNAVSPASRTNPSMAGIFTGTPMITRSQVSDPAHSRYHLQRHGTIAETLSEMGYATGAFCPNAYSSRYYGFDQGFDHFEDFLFSTDKYQKLFDKHISDSNIYTLLRNVRNLLRKEEAFKSWDTYVDDVVSWIKGQGDPSFLWAFSLDTHFPYITPRVHRRWSNAFKTYYYNWRCNQLLDEFDIDVSKRDAQGIADIYDDSIRFADKFIGELQERLDDDTIFVICADHGEAIDERGIYGHFYPSLFEENIHVPLVIGGGIESSDTIKNPVPMTDLPQILIELAETGEISYSGKNWAISSTYDGRRARNLITVRTQNWKYHYTKNENEEKGELFDLRQNDVEPDEPSHNGDLENQLEQLIRKRKNHEQEILSTREAVKEVLDD